MQLIPTNLEGAIRAVDRIKLNLVTKAKASGKTSNLFP
jgi:hypothetical protein